MTSAPEKSDFVKSVERSLSKGDTAHCLALIDDNKYADEVQNSSWDLIPIITQYLTEKNQLVNNDLFGFCVSLLNIIAEKANAEEALLQLIEEIEECDSDKKFLVLLKPLQSVLFRVPSKRTNSFAWGFNAIQTYLDKCELPENKNLSGKEKLLLDEDETVHRIINLYMAVVVEGFYKSFVEELSESRNEFFVERCALLCKFLVQLLGTPLGYLNMEVFNGVKSKGRMVAEKLVCKIISTDSDPYKLLKMRFEAEWNEMSRPSILGTAVLFYLVFSEEYLLEIIPKVYDNVYLFHNALYLATELLGKSSQMLIEKGLKLAASLLKLVKGLKLPYLLLDSEDHSNFCKSLSNVIIYNEVDYLRQFGLKIYESYLFVFELHGTYLVISNMMSTINHTGLKGYTVTQYKELVCKELTKSEENLSVFCKGYKLFNVLRKFCYLPKKEETNLVEASDQIIASLNLLRYLFIRDTNNATGIWNYEVVLENIFFAPLRKGIQLSKAHYELKIKELLEEKAEGDKVINETNISVVVSGQTLPEMSTEEKLKVLHSSVTVLDIMDSVLSRLIECMQLAKPKLHQLKKC